MNRHTKIAVLIAPFLLIGGYIATDYYKQQQDESKNLFKLTVKGSCDLSSSPCILSHKQLILTLSDNNGHTEVKSNHALEEMVLSILDKNNIEIRYPMKASQNHKMWQSQTQITLLLQQTPQLKIRLVSIINKGYYFSEFYSRKN